MPNYRFAISATRATEGGECAQKFGAFTMSRVVVLLSSLIVGFCQAVEDEAFHGGTRGLMASVAPSTSLAPSLAPTVAPETIVPPAHGGLSFAFVVPILSLSLAAFAWRRGTCGCGGVPTEIVVSTQDNDDDDDKTFELMPVHTLPSIDYSEPLDWNNSTDDSKSDFVRM